MKLIGAIVNRFNDISGCHVIAFDSDYQIEFEDLTLKIDRSSDSGINFYGSHVSNITAIVGNNGAGKTSILDMIACSDAERNYHSQAYSYSLVFLDGDELYLEMCNFRVDCIEFFGNSQRIDCNNYTGFWSSITKGNDIPLDIYYFQPAKRLSQNSDQEKLVRRYYKSSEHLAMKDASLKFNAYKLLVEKGFLSETSKYRWLIKTNTFEQTLDYLVDYCFRKMLPLHLMYEHNLKCAVLYYLGKKDALSFFGEDVTYVEQYLDLKWDKIEAFDKFQDSFYISSFQQLEFEEDAIREEFDKEFKELILDYKRFVAKIRFSFILEPFLKDKEVKDLSFKESQVLNCLIDTYIYIRDLYFPNYNSQSQDVSQWEGIFPKVVAFFSQLLDNEFIAQDSGDIVGRAIKSETIGIEPGNDISDYMNFTARFLRQFFKISNHLVSFDKHSCTIIMDIADKSIDDFVNEFETMIDYPEKRKIHLINDRKETIWFKLTELNSKGEQNILELMTLIKSFQNEISEGKHLIVVDEIEEGLHLEWSRRLLNFLISELNKSDNQEFQIIFTTHSPFMLSDIKPGNVIRLNKENGLLEIKAMENTFAKNIQEIMHDDLFIKDVYGAFAISKINHMINDLQLDEGEDSSLRHYKHKEQLLSDIDMISEPLLRHKLYDMYERKFQANTIDNRIEQLRLEIEQLERKKLLHRN